MKIVRLVSSFLLAFIFVQAINLELNGQELEPGTQYFDDVRGDEAVVTNAWDNVSNRVHQLIQVVSPKTDISGKQDKLPYPTNAIPYDVLKDVPVPSVIEKDGFRIYGDLYVEKSNTVVVVRASDPYTPKELYYVVEDEYSYYVYYKPNNIEIGSVLKSQGLPNEIYLGNFADGSPNTITLDFGHGFVGKLATTNTVAEMIATNKYSYITDGTNVIHSNLEYVRGGENKWVVKFTKNEYPDVDFLPHEYSFELLLNQYGQWQNLNLGSEHTLWYQNNIWFLIVYFNTIDFGKLPVLYDSTLGNENADYVDFTNGYGHWECSRVLYKRDKIALVSESITNNTLRLPMTDSTTSERVYLKVENGEVNIYKVQ